MVGDHVGGEANAVAGGAVAQIAVSVIAAEVVGDAVVVERVGGGDGILLAAHMFDTRRGATALPNADEPECIEAAAGEGFQFFVGDLIEALDSATVLARELGEPD